MQITETALPGVLRLQPRRFGDARGWFAETWNAARFAEAGLALDFVQDNHSFSEAAGTLRGLHFQAPPAAQGKLVRCGRGALWDVALDIRAGSPTYGRHVGVDLTAEGGEMLWIPPGFAHGFVTRAPGTEIVYKCTGFYAPETEGAVAWDGAGIEWGVEAPILSDKDAAAPPLAALDTPFRWEG
ncbi:MAG: dTDP-4-dehydrorhamnose 3,5-epimerase [Shimia sp.]